VMTLADAPVPNATIRSVLTDVNLPQTSLILTYLYLLLKSLTLRVKTRLSPATSNHLVIQRSLATYLHLTKDKTLHLKAGAFKSRTNFELILIIFQLKLIVLLSSSAALKTTHKSIYFPESKKKLRTALLLPKNLFSSWPQSMLTQTKSATADINTTSFLWQLINYLLSSRPPFFT
jgi:hypothetical protein